jgi:hypothetical protein
MSADERRTLGLNLREIVVKEHSLEQPMTRLIDILSHVPACDDGANCGTE